MSEQINSGQVDEQKTAEASGLLLSVEPLEQRSMKLSAGDDSSDTSNDGGSDTGDDSSSDAGDDTGTSTDTDLTDALGGDDSGDDSSDSDGSDATEIRIDTKDA